MQRRLKRIGSWMCVLVAGCLLLVVFDWAFRRYESRHWITELRDTAGPYDLASFGYHQHGGPISRAKAPGGLRVLSLGDSFAYSITMPAMSYAAVAEGLLQQRAAACGSARPEVEVVNLGIPGISFPEYIRQGRYWARLLDHDAVVLNIYAGNDFIEMQGAMPTPAALQEHSIQVGLATRIPRKHLLRIADYLDVYFKSLEIQSAPPVAQATQYEPGQAYEIEQGFFGRIMGDAAEIYVPERLQEQLGNLAWCREALRFLAQEAREGKVVRILVSPPHFWVAQDWMQAVLQEPEFANATLDPALPAEIVRQLAVAEGLDPSVVVDLTPAFRAHSSRGEALYLGMNIHWNMEGNALAGEELAESLAPELLPRAGCTMTQDVPATSGQTLACVHADQVAAALARLPGGNTLE